MPWAGPNGGATIRATVEWHGYDSQRRVGQIVEKVAQDAVGHIVAEIAGEGESARAWDTGNLAGSVRFAGMEAPTVGVIEVGAEYALYVHYGTVHMAARPYMNVLERVVGPLLLEAVEKGI